MFASENFTYIALYGEEASDKMFYIDVYLYDEIMNNYTSFPMDEINEFFNLTDEIPVPTGSSFYFECGEDIYGDSLAIVSVPLTECSYEEYKAIVQNSGLTLEEASDQNDGTIFSQFVSVGGNYTVQFYVDGEDLVIIVFLSDATSGSNEGEGYSELFPMTEINSFYNANDEIPAPTGTYFEYYYGPTGQGYDCFTIFVAASECSYEQYKAICASAGFVFEEGVFDGVTYGFFTSQGGAYDVQVSEYEDKNGSLYLEIDIFEAI